MKSVKQMIQERDKRLVDLKEKGKSFNQLSRIFDISPQRCHQIHKKYVQSTKNKRVGRNKTKNQRT